MVEVASLDALILDRITGNVSDELGLFVRSVDCKSVVAVVCSLSLEAGVGEDSDVDCTGRMLESVRNARSLCEVS